MKIVQVHPLSECIVDSNGSIKGGSPRSLIQLSKLFTHFGYETTNLIMNSVTDTTKIEGTTIDISEDMKGGLAKHCKDADLVVYHLSKTKGLNVLTDLGKPCMMICHAGLERQGIGRYGILDTIERNRKIGGKLICVSKHSFDNIQKFGLKTLEYSQRSSNYKEFYNRCQRFTPDDYMIFQYADDDSVVDDSNGKAIQICRASKLRRPDLAFKLFYDKLLTSFMVAEEPADKEYLEEYQTAFSGRIVQFDKPSNVSLDELKKSKVYINTYLKETAGYAVFEAVSSGVPVIQLVGKDNKSSVEELVPEFALTKVKPDFGRKFPEFHKEFMELFQSIKEDRQYRQSVKDYILEKFSMQICLDKILNIKKSIR